MFRTVLILLGAIGAVSLGGCQLVGFAASVVGDPPVQPAFVLPKKPIVVIVRDAPDPMGLRIESDELAMDIEQEIKTYDIAPLIPSSKVGEVTSNNLGALATMAPAQLGRAAGADQVMFVQILSSSLGAEGDDQMIKGIIETRVAVIDTANGSLIWPKDDSGGAIVSYSTPLRHISGDVNALTVGRTLHQGLAVKIGRIFHKYKAEEK